MAVKDWIGPTNGNLSSATNWSDGVAPTYYDLAIVSQGYPEVSTPATVNYTLDLASTSYQTPAVLDVVSTNLTIGGYGLLATGSVDGSNPGAVYTGEVFVATGSLTNYGWIAAVGQHASTNVQLLYSNFQNYSVVTAQGAGASINLDIAPSRPVPYLPPTTVTNDGMMNAAGGTIETGAPVQGYGTIAVGNGGRYVANNAVSDSQHISLTSGMLEIGANARMSFLAPVSNLTSASTIQIDGGWSDPAGRRLSISNITRNYEDLNLRSFGVNIATVRIENVGLQPLALGHFHLVQQGSNAVIGFDHTPATYGI